MLFNSISFLIFLPIVFVIYWVLGNQKIKYQNIWILAASYFFYASWDWRFLSLIIFSTLVDYSVARGLQASQNIITKKRLLFASLFVNIGLLAFFKYFNFFIESFVELSQSLGFQANINTLNIILPVGISFYTFQTLSYTIDVYKDKIQAEKGIIKFAAFVAFFPQLVAGPIERASNLLPQFSQKRIFNYDKAVSGIQLMLWGLFKKVVVADTCATYVNVIFENSENYTSGTLILGAVFFAFQIYGDFSGYSDIAIGLSRLFDFDLMTNFKKPYFSRDIAEFWRRWHISLSTWFRDYLYIPLGGSKVNTTKKIRNVFIIFLVSGFWHGANWTFIFWGLLNALFFIPLLLLNRNRAHTNVVAEYRVLPSIKESLQMLVTFTLVTFSWVFFRSESITAAFEYIANIFSKATFSLEYLSIDRYNIEALGVIGILVCIEWFYRKKEQPIAGKYSFLKTLVILILILVLGQYSVPMDFIYFQF